MKPTLGDNMPDDEMLADASGVDSTRDLCARAEAGTFTRLHVSSSRLCIGKHQSSIGTSYSIGIFLNLITHGFLSTSCLVHTTFNKPLPLECESMLQASSPLTARRQELDLASADGVANVSQFLVN